MVMHVDFCDKFDTGNILLRLVHHDVDTPIKNENNPNNLPSHNHGIFSTAWRDDKYILSKKICSHFIDKIQYQGTPVVEVFLQCHWPNVHLCWYTYMYIHQYAKP